MDATRAPLAAGPGAAPVSWTHRFEAWGAAVFVALLRCLPLAAASALGGFLACRIAPRLAISGRARRNLRGAFPDTAEPRIDAIVRGMGDNLGRVAAEYPPLRQTRVSVPGSSVERRGIARLYRAPA